MVPVYALAMDSLIAAAAGGIAMVQLGEPPRARELLKRAARSLARRRGGGSAGRAQERTCRWSLHYLLRSGSISTANLDSPHTSAANPIA